MSTDESVYPLATPASLDPGGHACFLYGDDAELRALLDHYSRCGPEGSPPLPEALSEALARVGPALRAALAAGRVYWHQVRPSATLRLAVDTPPAAAPAVEELEAALAAFAVAQGCAAVCLYDRRCFPAPVLLAAMERHRLVIVGERVLSNPYYRAAIAPGEDHEAALLAQHLSILAEDASWQQEISEREARYRRIFETAPISIQVFDADGHLVDANPADLKLHGIPDLAVALGFDLFSLPALPPNARARLVAGETLRFEYVVDFEAMRRPGFPPTTKSGIEHRDVTITSLGEASGYLVQVQDITERRRAEAALAEREALYRSLVETVPMVVYTGPVTSAGGSDYISPQIGEVLGFSAEEWVAQPELWIQQIDPADRERIVRAAGSLRAGESDFSEIYRYRARDGRAVWVHDRATVVRGEQGQALAVQGVMVDMTAELEAAAALRQSEERMRTILQTSQEGFWLVDSEGRYLEVNDAYCQMSGYDRAELLTMSIADVEVIETPGDVVAHIEQMAASGGEVFESRHRRKDGRVIDVSVATRVLYEDGRHIVSAFVRDMTEANRASEALLASERRYRSLVEEAPVIIYTRDLQHADVEPYVSPIIEKVLGWPVACWSDPEFYKTVVHPDDRDTVVAASGHSKAAGERFAAEYRFVARDGRVVWVYDQASMILDVEGRPLMMQGVMIDITERHRLEEQLRQSQKLETVGRLAGGVAHDFNNLLTTIGGYGEFVQECLLPDSPAAQDLAEVLRAAERASDLTRQLLAFSRRQVMQPKPTDLSELVMGLHKMMARLIGENIELVTLPGEGLWPVLVDPGQIEQVIVNLAVNARDAMPQGGTLTIETGSVTLGVRSGHGFPDLTPGDYVTLTVSDTGAGMPPDVLAHVFEPFFTTKETGAGSGLGLSTVHGIVHQHGGDITVESAPGAGSRFRILLPVTADLAERAVTSARRPAVQMGSETLLLVEDEASVRRVMVRVLAGAGYRVLETLAPADAIALIGERDGIDLLVTDVVMPQMSGKVLAGKLRAMRPELKVLFVSGYPRDEIETGGRAMADTGFLPKPFTAAALAAKVRAVLDGREA